MNYSSSVGTRSVCTINEHVKVSILIITNSSVIGGEADTSHDVSVTVTFSIT